MSSASEDKLDVADRTLAKLLPQFANNLWLPDPIQFVADARLDHADVKCSRNQAVRLGMLRDKIPDNAYPGTLDIGFLDTSRYPELWEKISQNIRNGSCTVGTNFTRKSPPLLQESLRRSPLLTEAAVGHRYFQPGWPEAWSLGRKLGGVVADCLDRASFHGLLAESFLLGRLGLLVDIGVASIFIAGEVSRSSLAAEIAVDALVVAIIGTSDILGIFVGYISHNVEEVKTSIPDCNGFFTTLPKFVVLSSVPLIP